MRFATIIAASLLLYASAASAQIPGADAAAPDPARLFRNQCATCHTLKASEPKRMGPTLEHVIGRKIGSVEGYAYTPGYRDSAEVWGEENLDRYLTNPAAMFPGSTMTYRQPKAEIRQTIIAYLKDQG